MEPATSTTTAAPAPATADTSATTSATGAGGGAGASSDSGDGGAWAVLVAGEHWQLETGERDKGSNHASLQPIGQAYEILVDHLGADHIIVIAQLEEITTHLESCVATGTPRYGDKSEEESKVAWAEKLATVKRDTAVLAAHGGADYDNDEVNPNTFINVLTGKASATGGKRVVPQNASSLFIAIYSHGWSHPIQNERDLAEAVKRYKCDICQHKHTSGDEDHEHSSLATREWFFHFPYEAKDLSIYDAVATDQHPHPHSLIYWEILFQTYHSLMKANPKRAVVSMHNFCGSGGTLKFMDRPSYKERYKVDTWPLFLFAASGELEGALTGGLWDSWFALLREALPKSKAITTGAKSDTAATAATATATATATASAGAGAGAGGGAGGGAGVAASAMPALDTGATLAEASDWAKRAYLRENSFVLVDKVRSAMEVPASVADKVVPLLEQLFSDPNLDKAAMAELTAMAKSTPFYTPAMCVSCHSFSAQADKLWMCGVCYRKDMALPAEERPKRGEPKQEVVDLSSVVHQAVASTGGVSVRFGAESGVQNVTLQQLFVNAGAVATMTTAAKSS